MANTKRSIFNNALRNPITGNILRQMYTSLSPEARIEYLNRPNMLKSLNMEKVTEDDPTFLGTPELAKHGAMPQLTSPELGDLGDIGALALGAAKEHPFKTIGLAGLGAGNIGGLMDNKKFGGQLAGLGLGGLGALSLASGNPYMAAMLTMGGGELGALFDKLRARKELEEQQGYPNAGNPIAMMNRR